MFAVLTLACGDESVVSDRPGPPLIPVVIEDEFAYAVANLKEQYSLRQHYVKAGRWDLVVKDPDADVDSSVNGAIDLFIELMFFSEMNDKDMSALEARQSIIRLIVAATTVAAEDVESDVDRALREYDRMFEEDELALSGSSQASDDASAEERPPRQ